MKKKSGLRSATWKRTRTQQQQKQETQQREKWASMKWKKMGARSGGKKWNGIGTDGYSRAGRLDQRTQALLWKLALSLSLDPFPCCNSKYLTLRFDIELGGRTALCGKIEKIIPRSSGMRMRIKVELSLDGDRHELAQKSWILEQRKLSRQKCAIFFASRYWKSGIWEQNLGKMNQWRKLEDFRARSHQFYFSCLGFFTLEFRFMIT